MKNGTEKTRRDFLKECALGALAAVAADPLHRLGTNNPNRITLMEV